MNNNCQCFSCSEYRNSNKIGFLKKKVHELENDMTTSSDNSHPSSGFDHLPNEVLVRILNYISPININDFITLIALEMVSKRFRRFVVDNEKIWENITELVIGFDPDLPNDKYLCHIGHFTLELFLRRVPKITKIVINCKDNWLCSDMMKGQVFPIIDRFAEKLQLKELTLCQQYKFEDKEVNMLVEKLINNGGKETLENVQIRTNEHSFGCLCVQTLAKCSNLKILKLSTKQWLNFPCSSTQRLNMDYKTIGHFLSRLLLNSLQLLEISDYIPECVDLVKRVISDISFDQILDDLAGKDLIPLQLQTLRFTSPKIQAMHSPNLTFSHLKNLLSKEVASSIRQLEIHYCPHSDQLTSLHQLFIHSSHLTHLKLNFLPCLELNQSQKIREVLENVEYENREEDIEISITFKHSQIEQK